MKIFSISEHCFQYRLPNRDHHPNEILSVTFLKKYEGLPILLSLIHFSGNRKYY